MGMKFGFKSNLKRGFSRTHYRYNGYVNLDLDSGYEASDELGDEDCSLPISRLHLIRNLELGRQEMASMHTQLDDMVQTCSRHVAALIDPLGGTIIVNDQHLFESKIAAPIAEISEKQEEPSIGLKNAMRCLELQRKIWDMGSLMSVVPAVPTVQFVDPFLAPMEPQIKLANYVFGCLESVNGEQSIFIDLWGSRQANRCCREDRGLSRREAPTAPIGSWFALWRPPDLDYFVLLSGYWFSCWWPPDSDFWLGDYLAFHSYDSRSNHIKAG